MDSPTHSFGEQHLNTLLMSGKNNRFVGALGFLPRHKQLPQGNHEAFSYLYEIGCRFIAKEFEYEKAFSIAE
jgi:hypothetical protein